MEATHYNDKKQIDAHLDVKNSEGTNKGTS